MKVNDKARTELLAEIDGLTNQEINEKPSEDVWSIRQVLEHLCKIETLFGKIIKKQLENGEDVYAKEQPVELTVDRSFKVESPEFAIPGDDFIPLEALKANLETSHQALKDIVHVADSEKLLARGTPHPIFGNLSLKQSIEFVGYHELRHIEQIQEIKEAIKIAN